MVITERGRVSKTVCSPICWSMFFCKCVCMFLCGYLDGCPRCVFETFCLFLWINVFVYGVQPCATCMTISEGQQAFFLSQLTSKARLCVRVWCVCVCSLFTCVWGLDIMPTKPICDLRRVLMVTRGPFLFLEVKYRLNKTKLLQP